MIKTSKLSDTDLCVMCGMCLPNCPTYQLYQTETESPRGRIALMQAIDKQRIEANAKALLHIDHCLGCLNCETVCPSQVPFGKLIDEFRGQFNQSIQKSWLSKIILKQATKADGLTALSSIASKPVLKQLINSASRLGLLPKIPLTALPSKLKYFYAGNSSATDQCRGEVMLFTGCLGKSSDQKTVNDAILILNSLGFDVRLPEQSLCCGALHQHNGQLTTAQNLLSKNQLQLKQHKTILFFSPACGESLKQASDLAVEDIRTFILHELQHKPLEFSEYTQAIALHESCSNQNRLKLKDLNTDLLKCVPGARIINSKAPSLCCGAGAIQSIEYPRQASALLHEKLKSFDLSQTNILVSDNIGCTLHIKSAVSGYNPNMETMHPVSFLARQLIPQVKTPNLKTTNLKTPNLKTSKEAS